MIFTKRMKNFRKIETFNPLNSYEFHDVIKGSDLMSESCDFVKFKTSQKKSAFYNKMLQ